MTANELRQKYLSFFEKYGHKIIPSASLIPENDPSVLFTTAGMHPLAPYLLGERHPLGQRLTNVQKCVRTGDIDEVGDYSHHTFFEMLGNWSLGDYFKVEAIKWSYEFLTSSDYLNLDKNRIAVSVFEGDADAPFDNEAFKIWKGLGINEKRIARLPKKNNWWGPAGATGPCGPDTEMFYWVGDPKKVPESFNDDSPLWLEIWNDVFMQYNKNTDGSFNVLSQKNVDTGMGLERIMAVVNGFDDNYQTELFIPIIKKIEELTNQKYEPKTLKAMRIIADHIKAATFILGDERGIAPSNVGQGYILRRLIRRAVRYGRQLGLKLFIGDIAEIVVNIYKDVYPELVKNQNFIFTNLRQEEEKFEKTLEHGLKEFEKGTDPFILFSTYGFPIEITMELARETGKIIDIEKFDAEFKKHQELSRTSSAGMFKGGLAGTGEVETKYHTATHLLNAALRQVLGDHVYQKGSNITAERMRFDFSHDLKLTDEEKKKVEDIVNGAITKKLPVSHQEMPIEQAKTQGAIGVFGDKYGDMVKVYTVGDKTTEIFSQELCGGPHVTNTGTLGHFKIIKEEAVSAGVRRIKAVLE